MHEQRDFARQLRRNMTDTERRLWRELRLRQIDGCKFRRQVTIGNYIADFLCYERRLIVELDGGQHQERKAYDAARTAWLEAQGYRVLRFWNHEVFEDLEPVLEVIWRTLRERADVATTAVRPPIKSKARSRPPHPAAAPPPSPARGEGVSDQPEHK